MAVTWADRAAPIVAQVIREVGRSDMRALRKALTRAYPFGERANQPYKAWLSEVRRQLGHPLNAPKADPDNTQMGMFNKRIKKRLSSKFREDLRNERQGDTSLRAQQDQGNTLYH